MTREGFEFPAPYIPGDLREIFLCLEKNELVLSLVRLLFDTSRTVKVTDEVKTNNLL